MMRSLALTIVVGTALAGCATNAPEPAPVGPAVVAVDPSSPLAAPTYMAMAASGDLFEIQSSQLALQRSQHAGIRHIAQMLITDHTNMSAQMQAAARAGGLTPPPPMLMPPHTDMMAQLQAAPPGPSFDQLYHSLQVNAHQQALALHQNYAGGGDHPALRTVAGNAVPIIQTHLQHLQTMTVTTPPPLPPQATPGERG